MNFVTSIPQTNVNVEEINGLTEGFNNFLLTINEADFLKNHLPDSTINEHGKPIDTIICIKKGYCKYICDIVGKGLNDTPSDVPEGIVTFNETGCDFEFHKIAELLDLKMLDNEGMKILICNADEKP